jgi:hypothetical protein
LELFDSILNDLLYSWHQFLWKNSFNLIVESISQDMFQVWNGNLYSFVEKVKDQRDKVTKYNYDFVLLTLRIYEHVNFNNGPDIYLSLDSNFIVLPLMESFDEVPIYSFDHKLEQIERMHEYSLEYEPQASDKSEVLPLLFESRRIISALNLVEADLQSEWNRCISFIGTGCVEDAASIIESILMTLPSDSSVSDSVASKLSLVLTDIVRDLRYSDSSLKRHNGLAWINLACILLSVCIPQVAIDPMLVPSIEIKLLQTQINEIGR